jgi:hypothetical protein
MPAPIVMPGTPVQVVEVLIPGPRGPGGPAGATHTHTQTVAAATWTVAHNLGFRPHVSVLDTAFREQTAGVEHLSANVCQLDFTTPTAGTARFS